MSIPDVIALFICLAVGYFRKLTLLRLLVYATPFIAENMIYSLQLPVNIGRVAAFAILALAFLELRRPSSYLISILHKTLPMLAVTTLITIVGVIWALKYSQTLELWTQSPVTRALRASSRNIIFWFLPIAFTMLVRNSTESRILIRDFVKTGIIYSLLGVAQLAVGLFAGIDPFPIIRGSAESTILQSMVGNSGPGRITSICGEPRNFSGLLTIWLVFTVACGSLAGYRSGQIRLLTALFLGMNILTGSRTGLVELALILGLMLILCVFQRRRVFIRQTWAIILAVAAEMSVILLVQGVVVATRTGIGQDAMNDQVVIGSLSLPIEFQDKQALLLFIESPLNLITGSGAGLWQYQTDPLTSEGFRRNFFQQGNTAIDSIRQNITALAFIADFGLVGLWLAVRFYSFSLNLAERRARSISVRQFKPIVHFLLVALVIGGSTDTYCNIMILLVLNLWVQTGNEQRCSVGARDANLIGAQAYA